MKKYICVTREDSSIAVAEFWSDETKGFGKYFTRRKDIEANSYEEARERYIDLLRKDIIGICTCDIRKEQL